MNHMNSKLKEILKKNDFKSLTITNKNFYNEIFFKIRLANNKFTRTSFLGFWFDESELVKNSFFKCTFKECVFLFTKISASGKSNFLQCQFIDCRFIKCRLGPELIFKRTFFENCQFLNVDFGNSLFSNCNLTQVNLRIINFINPHSSRILISDQQLKYILTLLEDILEYFLELEAQNFYNLNYTEWFEILDYFDEELSNIFLNDSLLKKKQFESVITNKIPNMIQINFYKNKLIRENLLDYYSILILIEDLLSKSEYLLEMDNTLFNSEFFFDKYDIFIFCLEEAILRIKTYQTTGSEKWKFFMYCIDKL